MNLDEVRELKAELLLPSPDDIAREAVSIWLEDGMEFCYIYESDNVEHLSEDQLREAYDIALTLITKIRQGWI